MDFFMWGLTGAVLGWAGYTYLDFNEERGVIISTIIGAVGGFVGGKMIAPMFTAGAMPGEFSAPAIFFAAAVAAGFLAAGNLVYKRWGV